MGDTAARELLTFYVLKNEKEVSYLLKYKIRVA